MIKLSNKKGFTMVSVGIIVVVTMLLISTVAISAISSLSNAKKMNFRTDIEYIQDEVDNYYIKSAYTNYPIGESVNVYIKNKSITSISDEELYQFSGEDIIITDTAPNETKKIIMNEIDFGSIGIKQHVYGNKEKGNELDKYVISTKTGKVYYVAGIKASGRTYYTIVPGLNKDYRRKLVLKLNEVVVEDVVLELSTLEYTNLPVTVKVKLPKEYSYAITTPVIASNDKVPEVITPDVGDYKEFKVNYTGDERDGNYSIVIKYKKNAQDKTVTYMVRNFDKIAPTIESISATSSKNQENGITSAYLILSKATDNLSGIKTIKYTEENITLVDDAKIYFANNGKQVVDNKIQIKKYPVYTIYVEDNAGNCTLYNSTIDANILVN